MLKSFNDEFAEIKSEIRYSKASEKFNDIRSSLGDRPLVLYGAGKMGKAVIGFCREHGIAIDSICDRATKGMSEGIGVINPDALRDSRPDAVIIVCSQVFNAEICDSLRDLGFASAQIIPFPFEYPYINTLSDFKPHLPGYEWAYDFYEDERSKRLVLDKIRLILCDKGIERNTDCDLYFEDGFSELGENEVFVDGGAYIGDTAEDFLSRFEYSRDKCRVYSFEPDKVNYEKAAKRLTGFPNVTLVLKGLWSEETLLLFNASIGGGSSFVCGSSKDVHHVQVTSLDHFFRDMPVSEWPTLIKMDIEGAENEALLGSADIIRRRKPKLAICAYHLTQDVYKLPQTIAGIRSDYRFALRQHQTGCEDTVLYAV